MTRYQNKYFVGSTRNSHWDYGSPALYFVTICTANQQRFFGEIVTAPPVQSTLPTKKTRPAPRAGSLAETQDFASLPNNPGRDNRRKTSKHQYVLKPTPLGNIAMQYWREIPRHFPFIVLHDFVVMPNHIHGILEIKKTDHRNFQPNRFGPQSQNLPSVIRGFKAAVKAFATKNDMYFSWQSRYHDHVVDNIQDLWALKQYIAYNPARWVEKNYMDVLPNPLTQSVKTKIEY